MNNEEKIYVTVQSTVNAPIDLVWKLWTSPEHITQWNFASEEWCSPKAENDLRNGGEFNFRMEAVDGSMGFDFTGIYDKVKEYEYIEYTLGDDRKVKIEFITNKYKTEIKETFEAENINSVEMQRAGWQAILDNFKKYSESNN